MSARSARARRALVGLAVLCVAVLGGCERSEPRTEKWNVLFVLSDSLRAPSLSLYGYPRETTPALSQFARDGVLFERHFSAAPYTRLSISQLMTSRLFPPMLMGREHTHEPQTELPDDVLVLPTLLREHGYRTLLVTAHTWFSSTARILSHFDQHEVVTRKGDSYVPYEGLMPAVGRALDSAMASRQPFFFYLHSMDTHIPFSVHEGLDDHIGDGKADERYDAYDSKIRYTDRWFGEVLAELERRGLADKTLVIFTSDHGEEFGEMGAGWSDRTHGHQVRQASTHVPLILRIPPPHAMSGRFHDVTSHLDLAPTLAALAVPKIDLSRYRLEGEDLSRRILRRRFDASTRAVYAINGRFFALRRGDEPGVDAIYDRWSDQAVLHAYHRDRSNYPEPKEIVDAGKRADMLEIVTGLARDPAEYFLQLPAESRANRSDSYSSPVRDVVPAFGERPAVYETRKDEHWSLHPDRALTCRPDEDCGPIGLAVASGVPKGRYKLGVKLRAQSRKRGYENGFDLTVVSGGHRTLVRFDSGAPGSVASDQDSLDAGVHEFEGPVQVIVDKPRGGVDIAAFTLDSLDQPAPAPRAVEPVDSELTERLRALGYVE